MWKSLWHLKPFLKPHRVSLGIAFFLALPLSALRLGPAPLLKWMVDDLLIHQKRWNLILFPILLIGLYGCNFFIRFAHYYLLRRVIVKVHQHLRENLFHHALNLSVDYFSRLPLGQWIARTHTDLQAIDTGLSCSNQVIREPFTLAFLFGYALWLNWKLTVLTLLLIPPLVWLFFTSGRLFKRYLHQISQRNGHLLSFLQESYSGIRMIRLFGLEKEVFRKFLNESEEHSKVLLKSAWLEEASHPMVELFTAFALAPIAYFGGLQVLDQQMSPGDLLGFFTAFAMMMNPLRILNDIHIRLNQAAVAAERIFEVFSWKSHIINPLVPAAWKEFQKEIVFDHVYFSYPDTPERRILQDISFKVPFGKTMALVGKSGSGKTSLIHLLARLFDVSEGSIQVDGQDLRSLSLKHLRDQIAVVSQDIFLLDGTIEENIRCGKLNAPFEEIEKAARDAHAFDFIQKLPEGFQTQIGERGQKLSGGEKQRLSLARAFLKQAPILVLDEATSHLDHHSEQKIQEALAPLLKNRTTFIIAHRLSTLPKGCDILVFREGQLVEQGTHESLFKEQGEYYHLYLSGDKKESV